jgi:hypothetical protein
MTLEEKVHGLRLHVIQRAEELGNVSRACREAGISRACSTAGASGWVGRMACIPAGTGRGLGGRCSWRPRPSGWC